MLPTISLLLAALCCAHTGTETRMQQLEIAEAERRNRLDALDKRIAEAEQRVARARAEADHHECLARREKVRAIILSRRAQCAEDVAKHEACTSSGTARTAGGGALGCLAGLAFAAATGGAAAPAVLVGCGGGAMAGAALRKRCGDPPDCVQFFNEIEHEVLAKHGDNGNMPACPAPPTAEP